VERFVVDGFGDDAEAKFVAHLGENFQAGFTESLKTVRGSAGLVGAAAEEANAGGPKLARDFETLRFGFDGAWPRDEREMCAADEDVPRGSGNADDRVFFLGVSADEFVGLADGDALDHAGHGFEDTEVDCAVIAGDADGGTGGSGNWVGFKTERLDALADRADL